MLSLILPVHIFSSPGKPELTRSTVEINIGIRIASYGHAEHQLACKLHIK